MKYLVLVSLVTYCTCVPVTFSKLVSINVQGEQPDEKFNQLYQTPSYWNQQRYSDKQWYQPDYQHSWYEKNFQQYLPWAQQREDLWNQYSNMNEEWVRDQLPWNSRRYTDSSDNELIRTYNGKLNYKNELPQYQQYFERYSQNQQDVNAPWTFEQVLRHVFQELYSNYEQTPYSREQLLKHILKYKNYLPNQPLSQEDLEQWVELVYRLQFRVLPYLRQDELKSELSYGKTNPWVLFNYLGQNKVENKDQKWEQPLDSQWNQVKGQEWRFPWSQKYKQYQQQNEVADQWDVPQQAWRWDQSEYPQIWNGQQQVPHSWWWKQQWSPLYKQQ